MTNYKLGRRLLVALAIIGLAFAAPVASAHGNDTTADDAPTDNGEDDWATWMEAQMAEHMGPEGVEWMESHMGVTVDEMAQDMPDEEHNDRADEEHHDRKDDGNPGGMYGQGHC